VPLFGLCSLPSPSARVAVLGDLVMWWTTLWVTSAGRRRFFLLPVLLALSSLRLLSLPKSIGAARLGEDLTSGGTCWAEACWCCGLCSCVFCSIWCSSCLLRLRSRSRALPWRILCRAWWNTCDSWLFWSFPSEEGASSEMPESLRRPAVSIGDGDDDDGAEMDGARGALLDLLVIIEGAANRCRSSRRLPLMSALRVGRFAKGGRGADKRE